MNKKIALTLAALALAPSAALPAFAQAAAPAVATGYSVEATELGTLLDDPAAKAVLSKYIADMINNEQIGMARSMTLKQLQQYAGDSLTDDKMKQIQADLGKLPAKK